MSELRAFKSAARKKALDSSHEEKIQKAISSYKVAVGQTRKEKFSDWQEARRTASEKKRYALENLAELLETFENNAVRNGAEVLWASTAEEAVQHILGICAESTARVVVKSKSMTTEEMGLNEALEHSGIEVFETDLGELIVQLAEEKPYHIVTPAMHKSKEDISQIFKEKLGCKDTADAEELTLEARKYLRSAFCKADIGITGANFLLADIGAISLTENEGNARLSTACPKIHIAIAGIEKVLPSVQDLDLFLSLLSTSGTGQHLTCYNSIIRGPKKSEEPDGPEKMYVILLDNGRTTLYKDSTTREILSCIRCGACLNVCPVFQTVGGHSYNTTYQGPIGAAITPHLRGMMHWGHLSSASTLCGACTETCPVGISLHNHLLYNRNQAHEQGYSSPLWRFGLFVWAKVVAKRSRLDAIRPAISLSMRYGKALLPKSLRKRIPGLSKKSFSTLWKEHERKRRDFK